jgi:N-dimethylarginine dimethylaminohydrolase
MIVYVAEHPEMKRDLDNLAKVYEDLGIATYRYPAMTQDAVFLRDVFGFTPLGLIRGQAMGKPTRRHEPTLFFSHTLRHHEYWLPEGHFEGADLLWTTPRHVVIGVGTRTNITAAHLIEQWLASKDPGTTVHITGFPDWHDQHLLGLANVVHGWRLYVDERALEECGDERPPWVWPDVIALPHDEYKTKHSNWVQYRDNIVIGDQNEKTIKLLEASGANVIPVCIDQLLEHGGGVACATGMVQW